MQRSTSLFGNSSINNLIRENVMNYGAINDGNSHPLSDYYATLAEAQVDYPGATSLTNERDSVAIIKAIAACVTNKTNGLYFPASTTVGGYYRINMFIDAPYTLSAREGVFNFVGDIASVDQKSYVAVCKRTISAAGFRFTGTSLSVNSSNHLIKQVNLRNITFDGGWSAFNTNSDYPMVDVDAGYELFWENAAVTSALFGIRFREVFDSRFNNLRVTWCGEHNGKQLSMSMTNADATVTVSSTTGIFAGQKVYGTGVDNVYVSSVTNSTTLELSENMTYTGSRTVVFEPKAAVHVCSNNTTNATSNNQIYTGLRIESGPGCGLRVQGANNVDIWVQDGKIEQTQYALDYLVDFDSTVGAKYDGWLYGAPTYLNYMQWSVTTAGKTLASALSARIDTFTLPTYLADTGTLTTGLYTITGLADTSTLTVGQLISGTGITASGLQGVCIASIDSGTQVTMTDPAVSTGALALTFSYPFDSGIFYRRGFYSGMPIIAYDREDTRNYMLCRLTNYVTTTGVITLHVLNVFGDTSKSITLWSVMPVHAGLARVGGSATLAKLNITGGYAAGITNATLPYIHTMVHLDGVNGIDADIKVNQGHAMLPKNSWQAQVATDSITVGTGAKTFTIATGLHATMFAANAAVYISGNTTATEQNWMKGTITSYTSGTGALVTNITETNGSGTLSNWKVTFAPQSAYLQTGTNANLILKESNAVYGTPASSSGFIKPIISDIKAVAGGVQINNQVMITSALFATITPVAGTFYFLTDTFQVYNGSTLITETYAPYFSGKYYGIDVANVATFSSVVADRMYAMPLWIRRKASVASVGLRVITGGTGSNVKGAIYDATGTNGRPGTLIGQSTTGVATTSSNTDVDIALDANVTLYPGLYWLSSMHTTTTTLPTVNTYNTLQSLTAITGSNTIRGAIGDSAATNGFVYAAGTYASNFPSTFGSATEVTGNSGILMAIKIA